MKNTGAILIGGGVTLLVGYFIYDKFFKKTSELINEEPIVTGTNPTPILPPAPTTTYASVDAALLKNAPSVFRGKKVYAKNNNTNIYTSINTPYTKAAAGQLIGTFAGNIPTSQGGNMINIKTTDPSNPYVKAQGGQLKF